MMAGQRVLTGGRSNLIKARNIQAILMALLRYGNVSRVRLARMIGVSATTVTNLTSELLEQGVVAEASSPPRVRRRFGRGRGRPQRDLRLVPDARFAVAIHVDVDHINVALTDLHAQPLRTQSIALADDTSPDKVLPEIASAV